jgi:hypothetical protein
VFDVDDPENQAPAVDPNGTAGDDNIGTNGGPTALTVPSDTDGFSRADIQLSTQPGDNFRIAAGCDRAWLDSLVVDGTSVTEPDGETPSQFKGRVSDMVTVWRYLHLEVDTMGPVHCNVLQGTVNALKSVRGGATQLKLSDVTDHCGTPFNLKTDTLTGEFIGGALRVSGVTYEVVASRAEEITVAGRVPTAAVGSTALLVDDDNLGGGPLDGDTDDSVPPPDLSLLQNSTDKASNILAVAYVVPVADLPRGLFPTIQLNTPDEGPISAIYQYDWRAHDNDPNFWTGYVLGGYQGPADFDDDPETPKVVDPDSRKRDVVVMGLTDFTNTGSMVFAETIRDANLVFGPPDQTSPGCRPGSITAHEVVHLFDQGSVHLQNGNGLMSAACVTATNFDGQIYLADETVRTIRSARHP